MDAKNDENSRAIIQKAYDLGLMTSNQVKRAKEAGMVFERERLIHRAPKLMLDWDWDENDEDIIPNQIIFDSTYLAHWKCHECGYKWEKAVNERVKHQTCPCCNNRIVVKGLNDLKSKRPEVAARWHPTKNKELTPEDVTCGFTKKTWWRCPRCGHEYERTVASEVNSLGCPVCANRVLASGKNDFATVHPDIAKQWHPTKNEGLSPSEFLPGSNTYVWWVCPDCKHEWRTSFKHRSQGTGCPRCQREKQTENLILMNMRRRKSN